MLGWTPPIWPVKGYTFNMTSQKKLMHTIYFAESLPFIMVPFKDFIRVSGFCEFTGLDDKSVNSDRIEFIAEYVKNN